MTREEALTAITKALTTTVGDVDGTIGEDTNLVDEGMLDSLDSMTFLFELENDLGMKLEAIDETYEDFRVGSIVDIIVAATS
ncbi:MAG: phosphopantetheine-binding protein [Actinobacteria bacterium]|nr:phosphopantetheine-binding protein [Actinomycetota bacterium]